MDKELERQIFHICIGLLALAGLFLFGKGFLLAALFFTIIIGTLLINARMLGRDIFFVQWFEERFERVDAPFPGWGSACYAAGVLILVTFLKSPDMIAAGIVVLAVGDAFSTIIGRYGKIRLWHNKNKSLEGTVAFFISSLVGWIFIGPLIIPLAFIGALIESLPMPIDDNITIPLACTIVLMVLS